MAKNAFLEKQLQIKIECYKEGMRTGRQQIMDMISLVLHDPEYVGKDIFGKDRLIKVAQGVEYYLNTYALAWAKHDEADYYRDKLDKALAEIYGPKLADSFMERYETAEKADVAPVRSGRWEWLGPNLLARGCICGTCSVCKVRSKYIVNTGICPNCGARMEGGAGGEE